MSSNPSVLTQRHVLGLLVACALAGAAHAQAQGRAAPAGPASANAAGQTAAPPTKEQVRDVVASVPTNSLKEIVQVEREVYLSKARAEARTQREAERKAIDDANAKAQPPAAKTAAPAETRLKALEPAKPRVLSPEERLGVRVTAIFGAGGDERVVVKGADGVRTLYRGGIVHGFEVAAISARAVTFVQGAARVTLKPVFQSAEEVLPGAVKDAGSVPTSAGAALPNPNLAAVNNAAVPLVPITTYTSAPVPQPMASPMPNVSAPPAPAAPVFPVPPALTPPAAPSR